jgi:uncharacterized protein
MVMAPREVPAERGSFGELSEDECFLRLASSQVGRVAMCTDEGPTIVPVNYVLDGKTIVVRTTSYTLLADHAVGPMAFEVDELEPAVKFGWSVLVVGHAMPVEDVDESTRLRSSGVLDAWAPGSRNLFIRITPKRVTGREIG